jgi:hypothetical protein
LVVWLELAIDPKTASVYQEVEFIEQLGTVVGRQRLVFLSVSLPSDDSLSPSEQIREHSR